MSNSGNPQVETTTAVFILDNADSRGIIIKPPLSLDEKVAFLDERLVDDLGKFEATADGDTAIMVSDSSLLATLEQRNTHAIERADRIASFLKQLRPLQVVSVQDRIKQR